MAIKEYKRGTQITANFKADEFICTCKDCQARGVAYLDDALIARLQAFRAKLGRPIVITSGNRCEARNKAVGSNNPDSKGNGGSRHVSLFMGKPKYCDGVDIRASGYGPDILAMMAEAFGFTGVGVYKAGNNYIHVDTRPGPLTCWWLKTSGSNTPGFGGKPTVFKSGHRSPAVTRIQQALYDAGYSAIKPDGKGTMDIATVAALRAFQTAQGLKPDGAYGKDTNAKLKVFDW